MEQVHFVKYNAYGNSFVIVDEINGRSLSEQDKSRFAKPATDICFGVGADNFIVIQRCCPGVLAEINANRGYWDELPDPVGADFLFRMFEPDGQEALSCGNGLMCIASYLFEYYGIESARVMTELPLAAPNVVVVGTKADRLCSWANLGQPRRVPEYLVDRTRCRPVSRHIDLIEGLEICFRSHDLQPFTNAKTLTMSAHLVFTGEPHLVVFPDRDLSEPSLAKMLFAGGDSETDEAAEKRINFGSWLVDHVGHFVNKHYGSLFPQGININFAHFDEAGNELVYRCFERGINHETLACGTGALAVAYVFGQLKSTPVGRIALAPHRCNQHLPKARIWVERQPQGWLINGHPRYLMDATFRFHGAARRGASQPDAVNQPAAEQRFRAVSKNDSLGCRDRLRAIA